jgi:uncharacterized lipoprotein YddW (UPF0748 family)
VAEKIRMLGVDYADDVEIAYERGELGDTPLIEGIMDHAVEAGMTHVLWRVSHVGKLTYRTKAGTIQDGHGAIRPSLTPFGIIMKRCDPLAEAVRAAHARGLKLFFFVTLFDECYQEPRGFLSESWLGQQHPEYYLKHYSEELCVRGVFSFSYDEVRQYFTNILREGLDYGCDGIYLDVARTHSGINPIPIHGWWPQWTSPYLAYGYNEPDMARYRERYGEAPPMIHWTDTRDLEPTAEDNNWYRVRGEALTRFVREVSPMIRAQGVPLYVCFFPATYNGFNPGYQCRQELGRYHIDWETWVDEGLIDGIRLNADHRRFGYDDWIANSAATYKKAQDKGVKVLIDCAMDRVYDKSDDPATRHSPPRRDHQPESLMETMIGKILGTSADGIVYYEHASSGPGTWKAMRRAHDAASGGRSVDPTGSD